MRYKVNTPHRAGRRALAVLALAALPLLMAQGCPPPAPPVENQPPVADAGTDQNVNGGTTVNLDGTGSSDPDGDTLSFVWEQTSGTQVGIVGATSATPSFTAPNVTGTLTFRLTVNDGRGGTDTDSVNVNVTAVVDNQPPVANAGTDQNVSAGDTVTLNGTGSFDPDGDTLTFSWTQTAGTAVALTGANTATPSFTAPNQTGTLTFRLTVNDGRGGTDTDSVNVNVTVTANPVLFIASSVNNTVVGYDISDPNSLNGNITPNSILSGAQTQLDQPSDVLIDVNGGLLVSNFGNAAVTGYTGATDFSGVNGNIAPGRNVQGAATQLVLPASMAINRSNDLLFVADFSTSEIYVYSGASTGALTGNLPPTRTIQSTALNNPIGINFGANDNLYVANQGGVNVLVFANASSLNGAVDPTRVITHAGFTSLHDVFIDGNDNLLVVDPTGAFVFTFNNASTRNGAVDPDFTLQVPTAGFLRGIAVDSAGNGYIIDQANHAVFGYNNIATRNGSITPDRTLQGANTQIFGPLGLTVFE